MEGRRSQSRSAARAATSKIAAMAPPRRRSATQEKKSDTIYGPANGVGDGSPATNGVGDVGPDASCERVVRCPFAGCSFGWSLFNSARTRRQLEWNSAGEMAMQDHVESCVHAFSSARTQPNSGKRHSRKRKQQSVTENFPVKVPESGTAAAAKSESEIKQSDPEGGEKRLRTTDPSGAAAASDPSGAAAASDPSGAAALSDPSGPSAASDPSGAAAASDPSGPSAASAASGAAAASAASGAAAASAASGAASASDPSGVAAASDPSGTVATSDVSSARLSADGDTVMRPISEVARGPNRIERCPEPDCKFVLSLYATPHTADERDWNQRHIQAMAQHRYADCRSPRSAASSDDDNGTKESKQSSGSSEVLDEKLADALSTTLSLRLPDDELCLDPINVRPRRSQAEAQLARATAAQKLLSSLAARPPDGLPHSTPSMVESIQQLSELAASFAARLRADGHGDVTSLLGIFGADAVHDFRRHAERFLHEFMYPAVDYNDAQCDTVGLNALTDLLPKVMDRIVDRASMARTLDLGAMRLIDVVSRWLPDDRDTLTERLRTLPELKYIQRKSFDMPRNSSERVAFRDSLVAAVRSKIVNDASTGAAWARFRTSTRLPTVSAMVGEGGRTTCIMLTEEQAFELLADLLDVFWESALSAAKGRRSRAMTHELHMLPDAAARIEANPPSDWAENADHKVIESESSLPIPPDLDDDDKDADGDQNMNQPSVDSNTSIVAAAAPVAAADRTRIITTAPMAQWFANSRGGQLVMAARAASESKILKERSLNNQTEDKRERARAHLLTARATAILSRKIPPPPPKKPPKLLTLPSSETALALLVRS